MGAYGTRNTSATEKSTETTITFSNASYSPSWAFSEFARDCIDRFSSRNHNKTIPSSRQGNREGVCSMAGQMKYKYLDRWPGSNFRQLFYKERKIRAETLYRATAGPEARTPDEVAEDY